MLCDDLEGWDLPGESQREAQEGADICTLGADSCCCTVGIQHVVHVVYQHNIVKQLSSN